MSDARALSSLAAGVLFAGCTFAMTGCARAASTPSARSPGTNGVGGGLASRSGSGSGAVGGGDSGEGAGGDDDALGAPDATHDQRGYATWYGAQFAGKPTASGERFDPSAMTAAHRKLRFGTWVEVRRLDGSNRVVRVRINDRGPFGHENRIIDLSKHAAQILGIVQDGSGEVSLHVVDGP